jgi:hypothetical protein
LLKPVSDAFFEQFFLAFPAVINPALVLFFVVIVKEMGLLLDQVVEEGRHAAQDFIGDYRGKDTQRQLLNRLRPDDVFGRPGSHRLGIGYRLRALRCVVIVTHITGSHLCR